MRLVYRFAASAFAALLVAGVLPAKGVDPADPEAASKLAREMRVAHRAEIDRLFSNTDESIRAAAVRKFLTSTPPSDPNPVLLDESAAVCSDSARLMVLDRVLTGLAATDALAISRDLADSSIPEERIVAWRNICRLAPGDRSGIERRLHSLLRDSSLAGTFAYGQALDGIVALSDVDAIPLLAHLLKDKSLAALAGMTLDRLSAVAPVRTAEYLNEHFAVMSDFPLLRADDFAKGSLGDPEVRAAVETYLARRDLSDREIEKYFFSYLQPGEFLMAGIFTGVPRAEEGSSGDRLAELREATAGWAAKPALRRAIAARDRVIALLTGDSEMNGSDNPAIR